MYRTRAHNNGLKGCNGFSYRQGERLCYLINANLPQRALKLKPELLTISGDLRSRHVAGLLGSTPPCPVREDVGAAVIMNDLSERQVQRGRRRGLHVGGGIGTLNMHADDSHAVEVGGGVEAAIIYTGNKGYYNDQHSGHSSHCINPDVDLLGHRINQGKKWSNATEVKGWVQKRFEFRSSNQINELALRGGWKGAVSKGKSIVGPVAMDEQSPAPPRAEKDALLEPPFTRDSKRCAGDVVIDASVSAAPRGRESISMMQLPSVMVIGVRKGGSTAIFDYLSRHGDIRPSQCKETQFLMKKWQTVEGTSNAVYGAPTASAAPAAVQTEQQRIALRQLMYSVYFRRRKLDEDCFVSIEGTPGYFRDATSVAGRIQTLVPNVKLVLALRKPTQMAVSIFRNELARGLVHADSCEEWFRSFTRAKDLRACLALRPRPILPDADAEAWSAWERLYAEHAACIEEIAKQNVNPFAAGYYGALLFQWRLKFPARQFIIVNSDDMFNDPAATLNKVFAEIGLRPYREHESEK